MDIRLTIPDYTTLSRRQGCLPGKLGQFIPKSITDMVVDSTGLKFYGEGEWKVKKHGAGKHRMWRKLNLGLDADGEIRAELLTDNGITDADAVGGLLDQQARLATSGQPTNTTTSIAAFFGDGAHDKRKVYDALSAHGVAKIVIPPQKNAKI